MSAKPPKEQSPDPKGSSEHRSARKEPKGTAAGPRQPSAAPAPKGAAKNQSGASEASAKVSERPSRKSGRNESPQVQRAPSKDKAAQKGKAASAIANSASSGSASDQLIDKVAGSSDKTASKTTKVAGKGVEAGVSAVASPVVGKVAGKLTERAVGSKWFKRALAANIAVMLVIILVIASPLLVFMGNQQSAAAKVRRSAAAAVADGMPAGLLDPYIAAGRAESIPWQVIASIAFQQTDHGRNAGDGAVRGTSIATSGGGGGTAQSIPSTHGRVSYFGSTDECQGMALWQSLGGQASCSMDSDPTLRYYIAMRWSPISGGSYAWLRQQRIKISLARTGKSVVVVPGDWGPHIRTGRDFDLSLPAFEALGASTDDVVDAQFVDPSTPTGPIGGAPVPGGAASAPSGLGSDDLGDKTALYPTVEPPILAGTAPDIFAGPMLIPTSMLEAAEANRTAVAARWVAARLDDARRAGDYDERKSFENQRDVWLTALGQLPLRGVSANWAGQVFDRSLGWINGESGSCAGSGSAPAPSTTVTTAPSATTTTSTPNTPAPTGTFAVGAKLSDGGAVTAEMVANAQAIINAGAAANVPRDGQIIAIATSLVESGLINLNHGDRDSVGLFQQRPSQGWGTTEQIMDPAYSAKKFYEALLAVNGWTSMPPGDAAQAVQRSAFPDRYAGRIGDATSIVDTLTATPAPTTSTSACHTSGTAITVSTAGGPVNVVNVAAPAGGNIDVAAELAPHLEALLAAAARDGIKFGGGGFRDPSEQIAVRMSNCGTSYYAIYLMPSGSCRPPTAKPGTSQHERGLAIDFTFGGSAICFPRRSSACSGNAGFEWLMAHAAEYGLYNLPSEAWHWSTTGN